MSRTGQPLYFVVNPISGQGKGLRRWESIQAMLKKAGVEYGHGFTERPGHAWELTRQAVQAGYRHLVAIGGDGSLHEVVNAALSMQNVDPESFVFGLLPAGTGNDWLRTHFPKQGATAIMEAILSGATAKQDLCRVRWREGAGEWQSRYSLNVSSLGFGGKVVHQLEAERRKGSRGPMTYVKGLLSGLFDFREVGAEIVLDGQELSCDLFNLSVGKGNYFGGGLKILPHAHPHDGRLGVSLVRAIPRWKVAANIGGLFSGQYAHMREVSLHSAVGLRVNLVAPVPLEAEGEWLGWATEMEWAIAKQPIQIFAPFIYQNNLPN